MGASLQPSRGDLATAIDLAGHKTASCSLYQRFRSIRTDREPLLFMLPELFRAEFAAPGVPVVVTVYLCMTFKADRNCIINIARPVVRALHNVIYLDLDATET